MTTINPLNLDTSDLKFTFDPFLKSEYRFGLDPSMSISRYIKSSIPLTGAFPDRPICRYYDKGYCPRGKACPDKHIYPTYSNK
jgi:cleavage and polyadenylation specificity factor subunit 4